MTTAIYFTFIIKMMNFNLLTIDFSKVSNKKKQFAIFTFYLKCTSLKPNPKNQIQNGGCCVLLRVSNMAANGIKSNENQQCKLRRVYQKLARRCLNIVDDNDNDDT